jgi:integrase
MRRQLDAIPEYRSILAPQMIEFVREKRNYGYRYRNEVAILARLDRMIAGLMCPHPGLPRVVVEQWMKREEHQCPRTHLAKATVVRQFGLFLRRQGIEAFVLDRHCSPVSRNVFSPFIFTHDQIVHLLAAADHLPTHHRGPLRQLIMPEVFRVLYGCGLRVNEALHLTIADVDLDRGVLLIRQGKFHKDRLVPMANDLTARLREYHKLIGSRPPEAFFFPGPDGGPYASGAIYCVFRRLLSVCGIPHGGRNHGPRLHDLRSTFAVHRMAQWYREGSDLGAKLPVLSSYMGHQCISGTQRYLRLTIDLFGDVANRLDKEFGRVIPVEMEA